MNEEMFYLNSYDYYVFAVTFMAFYRFYWFSLVSSTNTRNGSITNTLVNLIRILFLAAIKLMSRGDDRYFGGSLRAAQNRRSA